MASQRLASSVKWRCASAPFVPHQSCKMNNSTIDPRLLGKRQSGSGLFTSPQSPSFVLSSSNPVTEQQLNGLDLKHKDDDLDQESIARREPTSVSNSSEHPTQLNLLQSHIQWGFGQDLTPCYDHNPTEEVGYDASPGASLSERDADRYLDYHAEEPWNPLQARNTFNVGLQLSNCRYPHSLVRSGPVQQTVLLEALFRPSVAHASGDHHTAFVPGLYDPSNSLQQSPNNPGPNHSDAEALDIECRVMDQSTNFAISSHPLDATSTVPNITAFPHDHSQEPSNVSQEPFEYTSNGNGAYHSISAITHPDHFALWVSPPTLTLDESEHLQPQQPPYQYLSPLQYSCDLPSPIDADLMCCGDIHRVRSGSSSSVASWPHVKDTNPRRRSTSSRGQTVPVKNVLQNRKRERRMTTTAFQRPPGTGPLQYTGDNASKALLTAPSLMLPLGRPRRQGPLTPEKRASAARSRKNKGICIRCRQNKTSCDRGEDGLPCTRCLEVSQPRTWQQPCTKAHFLELVESGTLNYISQRAINHFTLDQRRRVRLELPEEFELPGLLTLLDSRRGCYNIRARQASGSLYVLDLSECFNYLSTIERGQSRSRQNLRGFIDHDILEAHDWLGCVTDCDPAASALSLLLTWNNMPSRASYDFVAIDGKFPDMPMNVEDPEGQANIMIAAQLSRIVCRKLEVAGYEELQRILNNWSKEIIPDQAQFVRQLGQILLTLRWRVSWWELLGDGGTTEDVGKERFEDRVRRLCRVLYFYYCNARKKLPAFSDPQGLDGVWSSYADASTIYDDFPKIESIEAFTQWMERGKELIVEAGVVQRMSVS